MLYHFHGTYSPEAKRTFREAQQEDLQAICTYLQTDIPVSPEITFQIYDTREGKQENDPHHSVSRASARYNEMTLYRFWDPAEDPHFPHEITHLVAHTWTKPYKLETELDTWDNKQIKKTIDMVSTSFMQEGLAIAVDDIVFKRKLLEEGEHKFIDDWCRQQINQMPKSLIGVIHLEGFGSLPNKVVVPFAASFSKFLLISFGLEKYKQMYTSLKETISPEENIKIMKSIYAVQSEEELVNGWVKSLMNE